MADSPIIAPMLVTPREASRLLSISERALWTLTDSGTIPVVRLGRSVRYSVAALQARIVALQTTKTGEAQR